MTFHDFEAKYINLKVGQRRRRCENKSKLASFEAKITQF
jgi:hypothetical protein